MKMPVISPHTTLLSPLLFHFAGVDCFSCLHVPSIGIYELEAHITENAIAYLRIISTGLPFIFLSAAFTGIYNAAGRSKIPFYISGTGLVLNILLDPLFIFGFGLGTNGAAYATWISQAAVFGIFIYQLRCRDALLGRFSFLYPVKEKYTHRILKLGLPVATLNTLFAFVNMFLCRTASEQGGHIGLMTFTTGGQIEAITWNTSQGFSTALSAHCPELCSRTNRPCDQIVAYDFVDDFNFR